MDINGITVNACYSKQSVEDIFIPLLRKLTDLQKSKGSRILVMLAAPPGAGKSTLAGFLEFLSKKTHGLNPIQVIGMDGFHRKQEYLLSHSIIRDGIEIPMVKIKGAPITFDLDLLTEQVRKLSLGENLSWPVYDRQLHNPVENALYVDGDIVLLEGNYLLLDETGWQDLRKYADYTISIKADEQFLRNRLITRRMQTGVDETEAVRFVDFSDMPNVRLCLERTHKADLQLSEDSDTEYHIVLNPS